MDGPAHHELDPSMRRRDGGRLLVGGTPPRLVRLSEAGAAALDAVLGGGDLDAAATALARRLVRDGLLHPLPAADAEEPAVTTVIPVLDGGAALLALVEAALAEGPVIVVDDGSRDGAPARAAELGARVIANAARRGPAGARNTGLRAASTDLVAFLDADCAIAPGWRTGLAAMLVADPALSVVAPRVRSLPGDSPLDPREPGGAPRVRGFLGTAPLAHYERGNSPLDLGPAPSAVGPRRRVSYLPAAALLARRQALLDLGGFDEAMRFGEDVDLVWRLGAAGRSARYVPSRGVLHAPRPDLRSFARQRFGYGASAPDLAARHGALAAPLRVGTHTAAVWGAATLLGPQGALAALAGSTALVASRGSDGPARRALAEEALRGQAAAARHLLRAVAREWLPVSVAVATRDRGARRLLLAALAVEIGGAAHRAAPPPHRARTAKWLPAVAGFRLLDHASYAAGLWSESIRRREPGALLPRLTRTAKD
jgi:mycofactocin system glycosyltransferase